MNLTDLRVLAIRAAQSGIDELLLARRTPGWDLHDKCSRQHVDLRVENAIRAVLSDGAPDIPVHGEETGGTLAERSWVVDPIDGTVNLLRGLPHVGMSIGLLIDGLPQVGVVAAPLSGQCWSAERGAGAHDRDGNRLAVRSMRGAHSTVSTGPPAPESAALGLWLRLIELILLDGRDLRRCGSAALDLVHAASGVVDGHLELGGLTADSAAQGALGLGVWDVAAGALLVSEADGRVTDWQGDELGVFHSGDICAGAPEWHEWMLDLIRSAGTTG